MELNGKLAEAFNDQVTLELQASVVYRQLAIEMDAIDLPGIAGWFRAQAEEEVVHANKFISHMQDRGAHPKIGPLAAPAVTAETVLQAFEAALAHEKKVSEAIRELYRLAQNDGDIDSIPLLTWFIDEQLEEEATVGEIIGRVRLVNDDGPGLLRLDDQLGSRTASEDA
ncbi:ferritin-like protein [Arthrobacter crystallopoietes BAB-32]|uniref:Ferritin n=1 Tax=Arthrobacter crystallopoietes BAB-32 TaxID=1246476 RepID=N1V1E0_9MICC|nr:ferritin [Arthrobacter crystallopoietes]EMY33794.1 ferritin-like protein [Arthrobacter crystallopoietes BAB-32]